MLNKSLFVFWFVLITATIAAVAAFFLLTDLLAVGVVVLYLLFIFWWALYYYKLEYTQGETTISIKSGIFFKRERKLRHDDILWTMALKIPINKGDILTLLHTAGGSIVIFGGFSTHC